MNVHNWTRDSVRTVELSNTCIRLLLVVCLFTHSAHQSAVKSMPTLPAAGLLLKLPGSSIQVVCAGVWHNAVLCALCWLCALLLPQLLTPLYSKGTGAAVRYTLHDYKFCSAVASLSAHSACWVSSV